MFEDIKGYHQWKQIEKVSKGWSSDEKYYINTTDNRELLLRISDITQYEEKKKEYEIIKKYAQLGFVMSEPIDFGVCNEGKSCFMLLSWIKGKDLEEVLDSFTEEEQYRLGREAGIILKKIHSLPLTESDIPKESKKAKKLRQLAVYEACSVRVSNDVLAIDYVKKNIDNIWKQNPVYLHGDYHPGNLIYTPDGKIGVIDFNRWEVGDPYEEFYKLESFGIEKSIPYCIGQIDAYFEDDIPEDFWIAQALYVAHASLYSIKWAEKFGQKDIDGMVLRCRRSFENYDNFNGYIPKWYTDKYKNKYNITEK